MLSWGRLRSYLLSLRWGAMFLSLKGDVRVWTDGEVWSFGPEMWPSSSSPAMPTDLSAWRRPVPNFWHTLRVFCEGDLALFLAPYWLGELRGVVPRFLRLMFKRDVEPQALQAPCFVFFCTGANNTRRAALILLIGSPAAGSRVIHKVMFMSVCSRRSKTD